MGVKIMMGRKNLKRIARLMVIFYSVFWSMSFTVSAGEIPVAELSVSDMPIEASQTDPIEESSIIDGAVSETSDAEADAEPSLEDDAEAAIETEDIDSTDNPSSDEISDGNFVPEEELVEDPTESEENTQNEDVLSDPDVTVESTEDIDEAVLLDDGEGEDTSEDPPVLVFTRTGETMQDPKGGYFLYLEDLSITYEFSVWMNLGGERYFYGNDLDYFLSGKETDFAPDELTKEYMGAKISSVSDRGIATLDVSEFSSDQNTYFYIIARCEYEGEYYYGSMKLRYIPYDVDLRNIRMLRTPPEFNISGYDKVVYEITGYRSELMGEMDGTARLDPGRIEWGLRAKYDKSAEVVKKVGNIEIIGHGTTAEVILEKATHSTIVVPVLRYHNEDGTVVENMSRFALKRPVDDDVLGARIQADKMKVGLYNSTNAVPISIHHVEGEKSFDYTEAQKVVECNVIQASFTDETLNKLFDVLPLTVGSKDDTTTNAVNIRAKKEALDPANEECAAILQNLIKSPGVPTKLNIRVQMYSAYDNYEPDHELVTENEITLTFSDAKPAIKSPKAAETLVFNSYEAGRESTGISFTGADIAYFTADNLPAGFSFDKDRQTISTTDQLPGSGKGSFKVKAYLGDATYNLPGEVGYDVTVNYVIKQTSPAITVSKTSTELNKFTKDGESVTATIVNTTDSTIVDAAVLDSKGVAIAGEQPLDVEVKPEEETDSAVVNIKVTDKAQAGQTLKVRVYAKNTFNNRMGAYKDVTVKIVAEKKAAVNKLGLTIKAVSGTSLDASAPHKPLKLTVAGKNFNIYGKTPEVNIFVNGDNDIKELFDVTSSPDGKSISISEKFGEGHYFDLLGSYAGKQVNIKVTYQIDETAAVSGNFKTTIKKTTVTPKLGVSKISINPDYDSRAIIVPITNLPEQVYDYRITQSLGKNSSVNPPFECEVISSDDYPGLDVLKITPKALELKSAAGKTCTVTLLPTKNVTGISSSHLSAKAAALKITVLDTGKKNNAAAITCKAKGSIDSVKAQTNVTATVGFKNIYNAEDALENLQCESITFGKSTENVLDDFGVQIIDNTLIIRNDTEALSTGSYKAKIVATLKDGKGSSNTLATTFTFKVTRGKTGLTAVTKKGTLYNRDFNNTSDYKFKKKTKGINAVSEVKPSKEYEGKYNITLVADEADHVIIRAAFEKRTGYYEKTKDKKGKESPITKAVTKKIPVEVYYEGSATPDKVTISVTIKP